MPLDISSVQTQLDLLRQNQDYFAQAKAVYDDVPPDTKKALAQKWVSKAKDITEGKMTSYGAEQQAIDHRRIIPLDSALRALQTLEADLVRSQIEDLADLLWSKFSVARRVYEALFTDWSAVWKLVRELWDFVRPPTPTEIIDSYKELIGGLATVTAFGIEGLTQKSFVSMAISVAKSRDSCVATMRKKAFPQSNGKRYRRRKRAR